jgi:hypothetical protein
MFVHVAACEVEAGPEAGAAAGDVAPFLQGASVVEEDVGAVDGETLGGVAGERIAVVEVFGRVRERDAAEGACLIPDYQRVLVESDHGRAEPVAEPKPVVVSAAEHLVADPELTLAQRDGVVAEPAVAKHKRMRRLIEVVDIFALVGEHHRERRIPPRVPPPVGEQSLLRERRAIVDREAAAARGVSEVGLGVTGSEVGERFAFERVALAAVAGQLDRLEAFAQGLVEAAGADGGELGWVADQQ